MTEQTTLLRAAVDATVQWRMAEVEYRARPSPEYEMAKDAKNEEAAQAWAAYDNLAHYSRPE